MCCITQETKDYNRFEIEKSGGNSYERNSHTHWRNGKCCQADVDLLTSERERMENVYGLHFRIVGAVDSRGGVIAPNGISSVTLSEAKTRGTFGLRYPGLGIQGLTALEMIEQCSADVY